MPADNDKELEKRKEYIRKVFKAIGEDELIRYYRAIKEGKVLVRPHNYLAVIIAHHTNTPEEWMEKLAEALAPSVGGRLPNPLKRKIVIGPGVCSCGYDRVIHPSTIVSSAGTPPPAPICPAGAITVFTLAKDNTYVIITDDPPEDAAKSKITENLYVVYTKNPRETTGTVIYRPIPATQRYTPVERATQ